MKKYQKEIIGIYLFFIGGFILISLFDYSKLGDNFLGSAGDYIAELLLSFIGIGSFILPLILGFLGYFYFSGREILSKNNLSYIYYLSSISIWVSTFYSFIIKITNDKIVFGHYDSSGIGEIFSTVLIKNVGYLFTGIILFLSILIINMIFFNFSIYKILTILWNWIKSSFMLVVDKLKALLSRRSDKNKIDDINSEISFNEDMIDHDINENNEEEVEIEDKLDELNDNEDESENIINDNLDNIQDEEFKDSDNTDIKIEEEIEEEEINIDLEQERKKKYFQYRLPTATLLSDPIEIGAKYSEAELHQRAEELIYALETFGVNGKVRRINQGPVITLFEIEPDEGVRVNKFTNLSDDLSRVMKASRVRVIAPIPGTRFVGIEIPNRSPAIVYLKNIISSEDYNNLDSKMSIALGKTTSGKSFSFELNKMPHLLVAGATGSGKSVCINSIITSILYKAKPDEVKFILIDPKKVELSSYNLLKDYHLITTSNLDENVITKTENSIGILESTITEMERRFQLFSEVKVRNIDEYNKKCISDSELEKIPFIVIIIDELADLMMTSGRAIEDPITRLAQKARAIGIHLIVATQRPSVDVITGLIKSNFPARIAFQVSSKIDSRTIIDQSGAETLLGNGDMLFLPPGAATPIRLHGAYISLEEIEAILNHVSSQPIPEKLFLPEMKRKSDNDKFDVDSKDELLMDAARLVIQHQQASVSLLQRKFRIGYSRAGRIIDELEALGIVSGYSGSKARDVLVDESYLENIIK